MVAIEYNIINSKHPLYHLDGQPEMIDIELVESDTDRSYDKMIIFVKTVDGASPLCTGRVVSSKTFFIPKTKVGNFYIKILTLKFLLRMKTMKV
jgi:hypothetical protein